MPLPYCLSQVEAGTMGLFAAAAVSGIDVLAALQ